MSKPESTTNNTKEFSLWEKDDITSWLETIKFQISETAKNRDITGYDLCYMNLEDLKTDLLINSIPERNKLMRQIKTMILDLRMELF
jgi:hypothetical protein